MTNDASPEPEETTGGAKSEPGEEPTSEEPIVNDASSESEETTDDAESASSEEPASQEPTNGEDQTLTCVQCGSMFVFSSDEQAFFTERQLHSPPKRCKP